MSKSTKTGEVTGSMESLIGAYITGELVTKLDFALKNDTPLLERGIIDSLRLVRLVIFVEKQFGVAVPPEDMLPKNFNTIDAICAYLRSKQRA